MPLSLGGGEHQGWAHHLGLQAEEWGAAGGGTRGDTGNGEMSLAKKQQKQALRTLTSKRKQAGQDALMEEALADSPPPPAHNDGRKPMTLPARVSSTCGERGCNQGQTPLVPTQVRPGGLLWRDCAHPDYFHLVCAGFGRLQLVGIGLYRWVGMNEFTWHCSCSGPFSTATDTWRAASPAPLEAEAGAGRDFPIGAVRGVGSLPSPRHAGPGAHAFHLPSPSCCGPTPRGLPRLCPPMPTCAP